MGRFARFGSPRQVRHAWSTTPSKGVFWQGDGLLHLLKGLLARRWYGSEILVDYTFFWWGKKSELNYSLLKSIFGTKVFKNEPSRICGRSAFKNFTWSILKYFVPFDDCKSQYELENGLKICVNNSRRLRNLERNVFFLHINLLFGELVLKRKCKWFQTPCYI